MWAALHGAVRRSSLLHRHTGIFSPPLCSSLYGSICFASLDARSFTSDASEGKLVKRKVAIVAGYLGTGYHGVQLNKDVPTIEHELRQAIFSTGAMRESNFVDLSKIDWSRSSRTDKGVHAGCIVFSGKLLIDEENTVDPETGRVQGLAEAINAALPPTIRIFSCTRVNKRFSARKNCVLREYEYFMPLSFLQLSMVDPSEWDEDEAVETFCRALRRTEGIHDFHNFTKSRSFFYRQHARMLEHRAARHSGETAEGEDDEDEDAEEDHKAIEPVAADGDTSSMAMAPEYADQFADSNATTRKPLPRHRRAIYSCSGALIRDFFGEPYLRVHIVGQAFLLHQIRCMVGGALAVATKGMTTSQFDAAIDTNRIVRIPIAPAEGLVLLSSTFGGKLHSVSLYQDQNTTLATERQEVSHRVLLGAKEDRTMQKFREDTIYQEVMRAWQGVGEGDQWQAYLQRSFAANESIDEAELARLLEEADQQKREKKQRHRTFVENNRATVIRENRPRGVLPRQFTTKLCVRYSIAPGIYTTDLRRGIARHLRVGHIPADADEDHLFAYVDKYGIDKLADEGRNLRLGHTVTEANTDEAVRER